MKPDCPPAAGREKAPPELLAGYSSANPWGLAVCDSNKNNSHLQKLLTFSKHFLFFYLLFPLQYPCEMGIIVHIWQTRKWSRGVPQGAEAWVLRNQIQSCIRILVQLRDLELAVCPLSLDLLSCNLVWKCSFSRGVVRLRKACHMTECRLWIAKLKSRCTQC